MNTHSKSNKALVSGTIIYSIGSFGTKFLSFLIVPLYTFFISPADLGDYDLLMTTVSLFSPLLTLKISDAAYRLIINKEEDEFTCISATYQLLIRNALIVGIVILIINMFFPIWNWYYFIPILILDRLFECSQKLVRSLKKQKLFAGVGLFYTVVLILQNVVRICFLGDGIDAMFQSIIIAQISAIILLLIREKRLRNINLFLNYKTLQRTMLKYSAPLVPSALAWWGMSASGRYIIRIFLGNEANGIFAVAYKFPTILSTIFTMFNNSWTDLILTMNERREDIEKYAEKIFKKLYMFSFSFTFVAIPLTKIVCDVILSDAYKEASIYTGFLYISSIFQGFSSFCSIGYLKGKKTRKAATTSIYGVIASLVVNLLLIHYIGLMAASISVLVGFFVMWITRMRDIKEHLEIKVDVKLFATLFIISIGLATVSIWTNTIIDIIITLIALAYFVLVNKEMIIKVSKGLLKKIKRGKK